MADVSDFRGASIGVVGNLNRDLKTAPFPAGEALFLDGETSLAGVEETIGGGGANSAAVAAALGARCELIGQIGDDELGRRLEEVLVRQGVRCSLHRAPGLRTGTSINLVYTSGQRHFLSCLPNNEALSWETIDPGFLDRVDHLYRADIWFSETMLRGGNRRLLAEARARGVSTSLDLNWDPQWGRAAAEVLVARRAAVRSVLPLTDLVHGNIRELQAFTGTTEFSDAVSRLLEWGAGAVVLHMGAAGAGYFSPREAFIEPPMFVEHPVAATGCGDVLSVCLMLLHRRDDLSIPSRLRLANRVVADFMSGRRILIPTLAPKSPS